MLAYIGWIKSGWVRLAGVTFFLASLLSAIGLPAFAQSGPVAQASGQGLLPVRAILSIVTEQGCEPLSQPVRQGERYVMLAVDEAQGIEMRLIVDGWTGDVLRARPRGFDPPGSVRTGFSDVDLPRAAIPRAGAPRSGELERRAALPPPALKPGTPTPRPRPVQGSGVAAGQPSGEAARGLAPTEPLKPLEKSPSPESTPSKDAAIKDQPLPPVAPLE